LEHANGEGGGKEGKRKRRKTVLLLNFLTIFLPLIQLGEEEKWGVHSERKREKREERKSRRCRMFADDPLNF